MPRPQPFTQIGCVLLVENLKMHEARDGLTTSVAAIRHAYRYGDKRMTQIRHSSWPMADRSRAFNAPQISKHRPHQWVVRRMTKYPGKAKSQRPLFSHPAGVSRSMGLPGRDLLNSRMEISDSLLRHLQDMIWPLTPSTMSSSASQSSAGVRTPLELLSS